MIDMQYFRITDDIYAEERWQISEIHSPSGPIDAWRFTCCERYNSSEQLSVRSKNGRCLEFTLANFDVPVVSSAAAAVLQKRVPSDIQLIPVEIDRPSSCKDSCFILNALQKVACLDEHRSIFTKWTMNDGRPDKVGQYRMVPKLVVDPNRIDCTPIFRIDGWDVPLIISSDLREELEEVGIAGAVFEAITY